MNLYNLLDTMKNEPDALYNILIQLDYYLKYIHSKGYCIVNFDLKRIELIDGKLTLNSFKNVVGSSVSSDNVNLVNIFQLSKLGLLLYNNMNLDMKMNQEHYDFIKNNLNKFNVNNIIPTDLYRYYEDLFINQKIIYFNDYLREKEAQNANKGNTNSMVKVLSTPEGKAMINPDDNGYLNILFIPSIIGLSYLIVLFMYLFVLN